jgi:membrane protease YdiL (CAAX protease family)
MNWIKRNDVVVFLFLSFALSWWPWPFTLGNPKSSPMIPWGPLFAAFIVVGLTRGRAGMKSLLAGMARWRVPARWYALAILLPLLVTFAAVYVNSFWSGHAPVLPAAGEWLMFLPALLITTLVAGPLTEEPAWRGYLQPRLEKKNSVLVASLIVGAIWWNWHLPLMISDPTGQRPPLPYLFSLLAYSILFAWTFHGAGASLLIVTLMHGMTNTTAAFLFPGQFGEHYLRLWWIYAFLWWVVVIVVVRSQARQRTGVVEPVDNPNP